MSDEKTEEPTEHKLKKSREKGQVAKSQDLAKAVSLVATLLCLYLMADQMGMRLHLIVSMAMNFGDGNLSFNEIYRFMEDILIQGLLLVVPLTVVSALGGAIGFLSHVGFEISMEAVAPKFENLNPVAGLKKIFSVKSLTTFLQMLVKALILVALLWSAITSLLPMLSGTAYQSVDTIVVIAWQSVFKILIFGMALSVVLGPVDYAIQKHFFIKEQRMSKDEVKREHKEQDGDPEIKGKRKEIAREISQGPAPTRREGVKKADAVVVNPTHYAVAIRYRADEAGVPVVLARGIDEEALLMREYAKEDGVPIFANPPLARALYKTPEGNIVAEELFEAVAAVLRWVAEVKRRRDEDPSQLI